MVRIDIVDNGGQWTHREWRVMREIGVETDIIPNTTPLEEIEVDGLVLSGGTPRLGQCTALGESHTYIDSNRFPILGICAGHQFMARHLGGEVVEAPVPEYGKIEIDVLEKGVILGAVTKERFVVWESHNDEVSAPPEGFRVLARSPNCKVQAMENPDRMLFGVQFHPEVTHTEFGKDIFRTFAGLCGH